MRLNGVVARWCSILLLTVAPVAMAQQQPDQPPPPETTPSETAPPEATPEEATPAPTTETKTKHPLRLYIEAGTGGYDADQVDSSVGTLSTHVTTNLLDFETQDFARAAIGWRLGRGRGDFRLIFNGYSETGYELNTTGKLAALDPNLGTSPDVKGPLEWWYLTAKNGDVHAERWPPVWDAALDDANGNGFVDPGEQRYTMPDAVIDSTTYDNMQNRAQTWDLVFGNVWGPRRFQGRWFAGLRYFLYEGNIPAGAWLFTSPTGDGFTDGVGLRLLNFHQSSEGLGPTGMMEARFNFFDQVLQLYINGQATFILLTIDMDTGLFATLVETTDAAGFKVVVPAQLEESQTKSTWQTGAEAGIRVRLKNGLKLEAGYGVVGFLDAIMLPTEIRIPETTQESVQGTSAIYNTQDYVLKGWHAGIAFQF